MLFMVIERFKERDAKAIYRRLRQKGRMSPDGLQFHGSWIEPNFDRCFQLMECDDLGVLQQWIMSWSDLADFEIVPVSPSKDVSALVYSILDTEKG
ncbi:MAG: DUF3303 family protein [Mesorhizobium sp.]